MHERHRFSSGPTSHSSMIIPVGTMVGWEARQEDHDIARPCQNHLSLFLWLSLSLPPSLSLVLSYTGGKMFMLI